MRNFLAAILCLLMLGVVGFYLDHCDRAAKTAAHANMLLDRRATLNEQIENLEKLPGHESDAEKAKAELQEVDLELVELKSRLDSFLDLTHAFERFRQ